MLQAKNIEKLIYKFRALNIWGRSGMFKHLAKLIEKHPWFIVITILVITIGFSSLLPSLEMKTDIKDFMPDDETVKANMRILDYFGGAQPTMFLYIKVKQVESVMTAEALREMYYIQKNLESMPEVNGSVSILTFVDQLCWMEYGTGFENCTDQQIDVVIGDLLSDQADNITILKSDDPDRSMDYDHPILSKVKHISSMDLKNGYITYNETSLIFAIRVYDLSSLQSALRQPMLFTNAVEWYIGFDNLMLPSKEMGIHYEIAARVEPKDPLWILGKKPVQNIDLLYSQLRNKQLFNAYKKQAYLWIKIPTKNLSYPIPLNKTTIDLDYTNNTIIIKAPQEELGRFGIAPQFGIFSLPAKLTNFTIGTRLYQTPILKLPWNRVAINTTFLIETIEKIQNRPIINKVLKKLLRELTGINWSEYENLMNTGNQTMPLPEMISTKDIETRWINIDSAPDKGKIDDILFIKPSFFKEMQVNARGFLSKDHEKNKIPSATLMILQLRETDNYQETIDINKKIVNYAERLDEKYPYVALQATGDGVITAQINEITSKANNIIGPSIFIIILIILLLSFRRISYILLPLLSLIVSVIWVFGTMVLLDMPFNTMAVAIVPLLMGLGIDYSVHLSHTYKVELERGKKPGEAIYIAVRDIGEAMFLAMITTVIAFLSFLTAIVPPVRNFGIILALGIFYTFINAITLQTSIRYIIDRKMSQSQKNRRKRISLRSSMERISDFVMKHRRSLLTAILTVSLIMGFGAIQIETGFDYRSFLPENNQAIEVFNEIAESFPYASQDREYILIEGNIATVKTLEGIKKTMENLDDDTFVARKADNTVKASSIYTLIQQAVLNNRTLIKKYNIDEKTMIPKTDDDVRRLYDYLYNSNDYQIQAKSILYMEKNDYKATTIQIYIDPSISLDSSDLNKNIGVLKEELNQDMENYGDASAIATGPFLITYTITKSLTHSQITSTIVSFILAALLLMIVYRDPILGLIAMIPVGISMVWILGTMHFIGYTLNVLTITVTSLTIGIGIDYAIYITERFRLIAERTGDVNKAMHEAISHTGGALLISALTTAAGFGVLILAPIPPEVQFGVITAMTIVYAFLISMFLLPIVLTMWGRWRKKQRGYIISPGKPEY